MALVVLAIGLHALVEQRKISVRLAQDDDARAHNVSSVSLHDANGREIKNEQTEEFNRTLSKVIEGSEMRFSLAKYQSMSRPWIVLGGLLTAYSIFMMYKLKAAGPDRS